MTNNQQSVIAELYKRLESDPTQFDENNANVIKELYSRIPQQQFTYDPNYLENKELQDQGWTTSVEPMQYVPQQSEVQKILTKPTEEQVATPDTQIMNPTVTTPISKDQPLWQYETEERKEEFNEVLQEKNKYDIVDSVTDLIERPEQLVPFLGDAMEAKHLATIMTIANKVDNDIYINPQEQAILYEFINKAEQESTVGGMILDGIKMLPSFMGELGVGKVIFEGGKKGATKFLGRVLSDGFKKKIAQSATKTATRKTALKGLEKTAEYGTKGTVGTFSIPGLGGDKADVGTRRRQLGEWLTGEKDIADIPEGDYKTQAIVESYSEFLSEGFGEGLQKFAKFIKKTDKFKKITKPATKRLAKIAWLKNLSKQTKKSKEFDKMLKKYGSWNGLAIELTEEEFGRRFRDLFYHLGVDDPNFDYKTPTMEELGVEVAVLSVPGIASSVVRKQSLKSEKVARRKLDTKLFNNQAWQEIQRAKKANKITQEQAMLAEHFVSQDPKKYAETSVLEINDIAKQITKEELEKAGKKFSEFGLSDDTEVADIAGTTRFQTFDGVRKVLVGIYEKSDESTVVEEFLGHFYKTMSAKDKATWDKYYEQYDGDLSNQELYEKEGVNYFFKTKQWDKSLPTRVFEKLKELYQRITGQVDKSVLDLYKRGSRGQISGEVAQETDDSFEVRPVRPIPESQMDNMGLEPVKGGVYVDPITKKPYKTGASYNQGSINVSGKFPKFSIDDVETNPTTKESGPIVRTNLTRGKLYTWLTGDVPKDWQGQNPVENNPAKNNQGPVIAVHQGKDHFYTLESNYDVPLSLNTYPEKGNPTLRPTANGILEFGNVVGQIHYPGSTKLTQEEQAEVKKHLIEKTGNPNVSVPTTGKIHPVYDKITIKDRRDTDESFELKEVTDENQLNVAREERKTIQVKNVKLTDKERKLISESDLDVDKKEIANAIRSIKAKHPKKDGWAEIEVADNTYKKGKVSNYSISLNKSGNLEIEFEKQQYTFGLGKNGKIAQGKERKKLETKLGNRVVKEVLKVVDRARNGDKNAQTILKQKTWYSSLKQGIREQYGGFLDIFAEALGVLSPKTPVDANYKSAEIFLEEFTKGSYDSMIEPFVEYIEQGGKPGKYDGPVPTKPNGAKFGTNSRQSLSVLASMWIELKPGMSPKARNFAGNILGTIDKATIDVWAGRFLQRISGGKTIPPKAEMAVSGNVLKSGEYGGNFGIGGGAFAHAVEKLRRMNIKELEGLDTPSLQAVVWFLEKEVWTKNNWTTKSGEGGSFESNLLREQLPKSKGGKTVPRDYSRTQVGVSEIADLKKEIIESTKGDANIKVVRAESSLGMSTNKPEKSYDTELVTTKDYYPNKVIDKVIKYAKKDNQDAVFVSKVLKPGEDHPNSRPGLEVYFNKNLSEADTKPLIKMIMDNGFDGFTFIREQRTPENQYTGVRIQVVPELTARGDSELSNQFKDEQFFEEWMDKHEEKLEDLQNELKTKYSSYDINYNDYITEVIFKENYDKTRKKTAKNDQKTWSRSTRYNRVQEATRESEKSQGKSGQNLDRDKKESYQLKPFYSPATKAVENPRFGKSKQVQGILPYLKNQQVKDDEIKWLGLREWLSDKKGKISQEELLDFLNKNEVTVTETMLGKKRQTPPYLPIGKEPKFTHWTLEGDKKDQRELVLTFNPKPKLTELPEGWRVEKETVFDPGTGEGYADTKDVYYVRNGERNGEFRGDTPEQAIETALQVLNEDNGSSYTVPSAHSYDDPKLDINRLAMVRFNTRYDTEGNKVLFIDEIQSDWHQTGKKEGYVSDKPSQDIIDKWDKLNNKFENLNPNTEEFNKVALELKNIEKKYPWFTSEYAVPDAPYKKDEWLKFSLKRMLRYGAENGFDKIAWTTGEQQSQRYDLSKHIDRIEYMAPVFNSKDPVYSDRGFDLNRYSVKAYDLNGVEVLNKFFTEKELENNLGKTVAQRIVNREGDKSTGEYTTYKLSGLNLVNDEKGMKVFYNQKIPNILKKYFRKNKWDSKVEVLELNMGEGKINVVDNDGDPIEGVDSFRNLEMFLTESPKAQEKMLDDGISISIGDKKNAYRILYNDDNQRFEIQSTIDENLHMTIYELDYEWGTFDEESFFESYEESLEDAFNAIKRSAEKYIEDGTIKYTSKQLSARITPDMKESVMMGQESFQLKHKEDPVYAEIRRRKRSIKKGKEKSTLWDNMMVPISTRLERINPKLKTKLIRAEFELKKKLDEDVRSIMPLIDGMERMNTQDYNVLDVALKNGDVEIAKEIAEKYDLVGELNEATELLEQIFKDAKKSGLELNYIADYFPRIVTDKEGLIEALGGDVKGQLGDAVADRQKKLGRELTQEEYTKLIDNLLRGTARIKGKPGSAKKRSVKKIDADLNDYYMDTKDALIYYIENMNNTIFTNNFFGRAESSESIGDYVRELVEEGSISASQQNELVHVLKWRFNPSKTNKWVAMYKNIGYMTTMGDVNSAITQIGDLAFSLYRSGFYTTGKTLFSKKAIKRDDIFVNNIAIELKDKSTLSKMVEGIFKVVGLEKMDKIGKETYINSVITKYRKQAEKGDPELLERLENVFDNTDSIIEDLKSGKITDDIKFLAYYELLGVQPISISELPVKYLESSGFGRVVYMLKTFTVKQIDVYRRESIDLIRKGQVAKGMKNLLRLAGLFMITGASSDVLKDLLFGRDLDPEELFWDNILKTFFINKYTIYKFKQDGLGEALYRLVSPFGPTEWIDRPLIEFFTKIFGEKKESDLAPKKSDIPKSIPIVGKQYYHRKGGGRDKLLKRKMNDYRKLAKDDEITKKQLRLYEKYINEAYNRNLISDKTYDNHYKLIDEY